MSDETIKPALTPDEWDGGELSYPTVALSTTGGGDLIVWDGLLGDESHVVRITDSRERHAIAALALHGQPFGFTHEDLRRLRELIDEASGPNSGWPGIAAGERIAAKIAALLPPAPTDPTLRVERGGLSALSRDEERNLQRRL